MLETAVVGPLLGAIERRTGSSGVYLYRFDRDSATAYLTGWSGRAATLVELRGASIADHARRESPIVIHNGAWRDRRFVIFPEIVNERVESLISIPLIHDGDTVGVLNIGRAEPAPLSAGDAAALFGLSLPMGALLAAQVEYGKLSEQLADRKLLERAKGILQDRLALTEEQAYLQLRRTSRQRRIKLREVAREIIETGPPPLALEARHAS